MHSAAFATSLRSPIRVPDVKIDIPFKKFVLTNGLTLIVHEDHKAPIVAVNLWYHVGSKNESRARPLRAPVRAPDVYRQRAFQGGGDQRAFFETMERIGATDLNGTTNPDRTDFFENVPTNALEVALWIESDRMGHCWGRSTRPGSIHSGAWCRMRNARGKTNLTA